MRLKTWLLYVPVVLLVLLPYLFWLAFLSPRPPLTIDPAVLAGDGAAINYCEPASLEGSGENRLF